METTLDNSGIKLFALNSNRELAEQIAADLGIKLCDVTIHHFADGEIQIKINESIRGNDVFVVQSISDPINENFMELMVMIDALRRSSAGTINLVIPYYGYARADRKTRSREPITAKLIANFIEMAGADRVISIDLHAGQLQGFFKIPVDHLLAVFEQARYFRSLGLEEDVVVVAPDHNGVKAARNLAELLKAPIAIVDKRRINDEDAEHIDTIIGDVAGQKCIIVDDIIDTGNRMKLAAEALKAAGATDVYACATHAVLSSGAVERLTSAPIKEVVVTDTIEIPEAKKFPELKVLSVAKTFAEAISLIYHNESVTNLFDE